MIVFFYFNCLFVDRLQKYVDYASANNGAILSGKNRFKKPAAGPIKRFLSIPKIAAAIAQPALVRNPIQTLNLLEPQAVDAMEIEEEAVQAPQPV